MDLFVGIGRGGHRFSDLDVLLAHSDLSFMELEADPSRVPRVAPFWLRLLDRLQGHDGPEVLVVADGIQCVGATVLVQDGREALEKRLLARYSPIMFLLAAFKESVGD